MINDDRTAELLLIETSFEDWVSSSTTFLPAQLGLNLNGIVKLGLADMNRCTSQRVCDIDLLLEMMP